MMESGRKLDVHHHFFPDIATANSTPQWTKAFMVPWSVSSSESYMRSIGTTASILSFPPMLISDEQEDQGVTRQINNYAASICSSYPQKFGFFAIVPSLRKTAAVIAELHYAFEELHADGIVLLTSYNGAYLGHESFQPIWEELNKSSAVVFVHPSGGCESCELANPALLPPVLDYPHETTKTAIDMILNGTLRAYPKCKIILAHAGGTLPFLIGRAATLLPQLLNKAVPEKPILSRQDFFDDSRKFYYELALSSGSHTLDTLLKNFAPDRVLFGTDFPAAPEEATNKLSEELDTYDMGADTRAKVYWQNSIKLFPRFEA